MDRRTRFAVHRRNRIALAVAAAFLPWGQGLALPTGGVVANGSATISQDASTMTVVQSSPKAVLNWQGFSIGTGEAVTFMQPSASSIALNRVLGLSASEIYGALNANGQVFLVNPNGILFAPGASVNVGGLVASTLGIRDDDFLADRYVFQKDGHAGSVINRGVITTSSYAALFGPEVRNEGVIVASGVVGLGAGDRVSLDMVGDNLIRLNVDQAALDASIVNSGSLQSAGGTVMLTANSANALVGTVINTSGVIRAGTLAERNGSIVLEAGGGGIAVNNTVEAGGSIDVSAGGALTVGGQACCVGARITSSSQEIAAGSITLAGGSTVSTLPGAGSQTVTTPGTLLVRGGSVSGVVSLLHNGSGAQTVDAGTIEIRGGSGLSGTRAEINSANANADQVVRAAGNIAITGGTVGDGNQAVLRSAGNQTITAGGDIALRGGSSSGSAGLNTALILGGTTNVAGKVQTIEANTLTLSSGGGGINSSAALLAPRQVITTKGDVILSGNASGGSIAGVRIGGLSTIVGAANTPTDLTLNVGRDLVLTGGPSPSNVATIGSTTGQPQTLRINVARDVALSSPFGSSARIGAGPTAVLGEISLTAGRNILVNGGGEILSGGHLDLHAGNALVIAATAPTAGNALVSSAGLQSVRAKSLEITAQHGRTAQLLSNGGPLPSIVVDTATVRTLDGGGTAEIRNNSGTNQHVSVTDQLTIQGLGGGTAGIFSGGDQTVHVSGSLLLGDHAALGRAIISTGANQSILGNADIVLIGGSGSIPNGSTASITGGGAGTRQTVNARSLWLENSVDPNAAESVAGIFAANQIVTTTGDVTLKANASGGALPGVRIGALSGNLATSTNLTLNVGGNLLLQGGSPGNGVGIGSTAAALPAGPFDNTITINAPNGNVVVNGGEGGARIGSSAFSGTAGGNITINAHGIQLKGESSSAAIRTKDNVTLVADQPGGTIAQTGNAFIQAGSLNTRSSGDTTLMGGNAVARFNGTSTAGGVALFNTGPLNVTGLSSGNATLINSGAVTVSGAWNSGNTTITTIGADANLYADHLVNSTGAMQVDVAGDIAVRARGVQDAGLVAWGGQTINARSLAVTASDGRSARVSNDGSGAQTIRVSGGAGVDVQSLSSGSFATISGAGFGGIQSIQVVDGKHINVDGAGGGSASIAAAVSQTLSITGGGANAVKVGSIGALGSSVIGGGDVQDITAGLPGQQGSITIAGPAADTAFAGIVSNLAQGGTQTLNTSGLLSITGGTALSKLNNQLSTGIFHDGSGAQRITASGISIVGGASGNGNAAQIGSFARGQAANAGRQHFTVSGDILVTGGTSGNNNRAGIGTTAHQTIEGDPRIFITGGSGGGDFGANNAFINGGTQDIRAKSIHLTAGAGGVNNSAVLQAARQQITTTSDVVMSGGASTGQLSGTRIGGLSGNVTTATDLTMVIGGDLLMTGGSATFNGPGIGSTVSTSVLPNDIDLTVAGNVILNPGSGAGARIGTSSLAAQPTPGTIRINAGGKIELNGNSPDTPTAIRTLGHVELNAGSTISEGAHGRIEAGSLTATAGGDMALVGPNAVSSFHGWSTGNLTLHNSGSLNVTALNAANATLINAGDVTLSGAWNSQSSSIATTGPGSDLLVANAVTSFGGMTVDVAGDLRVSAGGGQDAMLRSFGGQSINAKSLAVTASDGRFASIWNTGPTAQVVNLTGGNLDVHAAATGGFAQIVTDAGGSQSVRVTNGDHIAVNGVGGGAILGAFGGAQTLSMTGTGANAIVIGSAGALGPSNVGASSVQSVTAGLPGEQGSITIVGPAVDNALAGIVNSFAPGGTQTVSTSGAIRIEGGTAPNQASNFPSGIFHNGSGAQTITASAISLIGGASGANNVAQIGSFGGGVPANAGHQVIYVPGGTIELRGSDTGRNNRAAIFSNADQTITGRPDLVLVGGGSATPGTGSATIGTTATMARSQSIEANTITLTNSSLANIDSFAGITAGHQRIDTLGDVVLHAGSGSVTGSARIGGQGGPTDLALHVGGRLLMHGGEGAGNGVGIGSSGLGVAHANAIDIRADGDVVIQSGVNGARIGSAASTGTAGGDIRIAGRSIQMQGDSGSVAIRTLDNVALEATGPGGGITQSGNAFVLANILYTSSDGSTTLSGPNQVATFNASSSAGNVSLKNTGVLTVTGMSAAGDATIDNKGDVTVAGPWTAGGTSTITVGSDINLRSTMRSREVVLTANDGAIDQAPEASIVADALSTTSTLDTKLAGTNEVKKVDVKSIAGKVSLKTKSELLTLSAMEMPGALVVDHDGAVAISGKVSALSHEIKATQDVTVGSASAAEGTLLYAPGHIWITAGPGHSIVVRGSDTTAGAGSVVYAGGELRFSAGTVSLLGGAALGTPAIVRGETVSMTMDSLLIRGGRGAFSPAWLLSGSDVNLTIGNAVRLDTGSGPYSWARIQTETRDGLIRMHFPTRTDGGYFVNGREERIRNGETGFFVGDDSARLGRTLEVEYD